MATVSLPDGTEIEFPDSMSGEEIRKALDRKFRPQAVAPPKPQQFDWNQPPIDYGSRKYTAADLLASNVPITQEQYLQGQKTVGSVAEMKELERRKLVPGNPNLPQDMQLQNVRDFYEKQGPGWTPYLTERVPFSPVGMIRNVQLGGLSLPGLGQVYEGAYQRYQEGRATTEDMHYIAEAEMEAKRNSEKGIIGKATDIVTQAPGLAMEVVVSGGGSAVARGATKKMVQKYGLKAATPLAKRVAGAALKTAAATPFRTIEEASQRQQNGEAPAQSLLNAFTGQVIDRATELLGSVVPAPKRLEAISDWAKNAWIAKTGLDPTAFKERLARVGINGVLGELAEERVAEIGRGIVTGDDFGVTGQIAEGQFQEAGRQLLSEIIASAAMQGGGSVAGMAEQIGKNKGKKPVAEALPPAEDAYPDPGRPEATVDALIEEQNKGKKRDETFRAEVDRQFNPPKVEETKRQDFRTLEPEAFFRQYQGSREALAALPDSPSRGQFAKAIGVPASAIRSREAINTYVAAAKASTPRAPQQTVAPAQEPTLPDTASPVAPPPPAQAAAPVEPEATKPEAWQRVYEQLPDDMNSLAVLASSFGIKLPKKGTKAHKALKAEDLRSQVADAMTTRKEGQYKEVQPESKQSAPSGWGSIEPEKPKAVYQEVEKPATGVERIVQNLRKTGRDAKIVEPTTDFHRDVDKFVREFGLDVAFIDSSSRVAGVTNERSVAFNVRSIENSTEDYIWGIAGHEVTHGTGIDKMIDDFGKELVEEYSKKYYDNADQDVKKRLDSDKETYYREGVASLVQDFMQDARFRSKLKKENTSAWSNLVDKLWGLVGNVKPESKAMKTALEVLKRARATEEFKKARAQEIAKQSTSDEKLAEEFAKKIEEIRQGGDLTQQVVEEAWSKFSEDAKLQTPEPSTDQWTKDGFDLFAEDPVEPAIENDDVQRAFGRANPATTLAGRTEIFKQDIAQGRPVRRPRSVSEAEAARRLSGEGAAKERDAFLKRFREGDFGILNEVDTLVLKEILSMSSVAKALESEQASADMDLLLMGYRVTGTEEGRSFAARRDPVHQKPEVRNNRALQDTLMPGLTHEERKAIVDALRRLGIDLMDKKLLGDDVQVARAIGEIRARRRVYDTPAMERYADMVFEFWINAILSGPHTHLRNFVGNNASLLWHSMVERTAEVAVSKATAGKLSGDKQVRDFNELKKLYGSMAGAIPIAVSNAIVRFRHEVSPLQIRTGGPQELHDRMSPRMALPGKIGKFFRAPTRLLAMSDEFTRTIGVYGAVAVNAYREAKKLGLEGNEIDRYIGASLADPSASVWQDSLREMAIVTFQQEGGYLGRKIKGVLRPVHDFPVVGRYFMTFDNFMVNAFGRFADLTPGFGLAVASINHMAGMHEADQAARDAKKKGIKSPRPTDNYGKTNWNRVVGNQIVGLVGLMVMGLYVSDDDEDKTFDISGTKERRGGKRDGQYRILPAKMFRIGEHQIPYGGYEPFDSLIAASVDFWDGMKEDAGVAASSLSAFFGQIADKNYLQIIDDLGKLKESVDSQGAKGGMNGLKNLAAKTAVSFVPNLYRQPMRLGTNRVTSKSTWIRSDDTAADVAEKMAIEAGFISSKYAQDYDLWGRPKSQSSPSTSLAWRLAVPGGYKSQKEVLPVDIALLRYSEAYPDKEYWPAAPQVPKYNGKLVNYKDYSEFSREAGRLAYNMVKDYKFSDPPTDGEIRFIKKSLELGRKQAKANLMERLSRRNGK
jgi:hypothetical protein